MAAWCRNGFPSCACPIAQRADRAYTSGDLPSPMHSRRKKPAAPIPTLAELRAAVLRVTREHGVRNVRVFGSFARGEQRPTSDVDLLVDLPEGMSLFQFVGLKLDLEDALHRKVDVVAADSIKPALREAILADARPL